MKKVVGVLFFSFALCARAGDLGTQKQLCDLLRRIEIERLRQENLGSLEALYARMIDQKRREIAMLAHQCADAWGEYGRQLAEGNSK